MLSTLLWKVVLIISLFALCVEGADEARSWVSSLNETNFKRSLKFSRAEFVVVEFFAPWCPHCIHFAPDYENIGKHFYSSTHVWITKVNADQNQQLVKEYNVKGFPTIMLFDKTPPTGVAVSVFKEKRGVEPIIKWIEEKVDAFLKNGAPTPSASPSNGTSTQLSMFPAPTPSASPSNGTPAPPPTPSPTAAPVSPAPLAPVVEDEHFDNEDSPETLSSSTPAGYGVVYMDDVVAATYFALRTNILPSLDSHTDRAACLRFLHLLRLSFPHITSRPSFQELAELLAADWTVSVETVKAKWRIGEFAWPVDGADGPSVEQWQTCRPAKPDYSAGGGYTCALWLLFHSLLGNVDDENGREAVLAIRDFVLTFFTCDVCREHFAQMSATVGDEVHSAREAVLWLWHAHNTVNQRLSQSQYPHPTFPTAAMCPKCRVAQRWDNDTVVDFLRARYTNLVLSSTSFSSSLSSSSPSPSPSTSASPLSPSELGSPSPPPSNSATATQHVQIDTAAGPATVLWAVLVLVVALLAVLLLALRSRRLAMSPYRRVPVEQLDEKAYV